MRASYALPGIFAPVLIGGPAEGAILPGRDSGSSVGDLEYDSDSPAEE